ncbi:MAG: hypothetical protein IPM86_12960 [Saprospiraceae bacterium]|nr:hypothetical protein [Saprospiraceae bacterium]
MMIYSCGLILSEMVNLRKKDIDSIQSRVFINAAKGKKDRCIVFLQKVQQHIHRIYPASQAKLLAY